MPDVVIRGGLVVDAGGRRHADIACRDGRITAIASHLPAVSEVIDARGLVVLPALIDVHVHFNEPGRTAWEGAATGSRALAAGGGTLFFDMPLNSTPCTVDAGAFVRKRRALEQSSVTDFALWGGLVPGSVPHMADMAAEGAIGFKAFMCDSGLPEFPAADDDTLAEGMAEAARLGLPVAVHAEDETMMRSAVVDSSTEMARFLSSRPVHAERRAIERAARIAADTGAMLHLVHVSSGAGMVAATEARARGVDVSIETCPHYLTFTEADLARLGAIAKCAPPLRASDDRDAVWSHLLAGQVDVVASDHSPAEPAMKERPFEDAWGGIAGVQSTLPVLVDRCLTQADITFERVAALTAATPARRFALPGKGLIEVGSAADLVLIDPARSFTLAAADLHQRHRSSPYLGRTFRGVVRRTIRRGETIALDGVIVARTKGHFVAPVRTHA